MNLGTIVYNNEIYNLDYMTEEEISKLLNIIENDKKQDFRESKKIL